MAESVVVITGTEVSKSVYGDSVVSAERVYVVY